MSENLLQELNGFGDVASQQRARLDVSQLDFIEKRFLGWSWMSLTLQTGIPDIDDGSGEGAGTHEGGKRELFQRSCPNGDCPEGGWSTFVVGVLNYRLLPVAVLSLLFMKQE